MKALRLAHNRCRPDLVPGDESCAHQWLFDTAIFYSRRDPRSRRPRPRNPSFTRCQSRLVLAKPSRCLTLLAKARGKGDGRYGERLQPTRFTNQLEAVQREASTIGMTQPLPRVRFPFIPKTKNTTAATGSWITLEHHHGKVLLVTLASKATQRDLDAEFGR